ncbi:MAG: ERAP1-like C-terminal domain-containing protein, partial [Aeromicrobium erythreum]
STAGSRGSRSTTDLRWTFVTALARLGTYGEAEIAAELERDNTISGRENAAAARAIRPDADAKEAAWHAVVVDPSTPNETRRQTASAFQVPGQAELLAPYLDRYLEMAETIIEDQGVWVGRSPSSTCSRWPTPRRRRWTRSTRGSPRRRPARPPGAT